MVCSVALQDVSLYPQTALAPSSDYRGDKTVITPFSSVSVRELSNNESSAMINFQGNLYEQIQRKSCPMAATE